MVNKMLRSLAAQSGRSSAAPRAALGGDGRSHGRVCLLGLFTLVMACAVEEPASVGHLSPLESVLTGNAARALSADGTFPVAASAQGNRKEIDQQRATELAAAWLRTHINYVILHVLETDRGAPIALSKLKPCGRAFYENSLFEALPLEAPDVVQKIAGSHWVVPFCEGSDQQLSVSVSVYASDIATAPPSNQPSSTGVDYWVVAIPPGRRAPAFPEDVALFVADKTGSRITEVPELISTGYGSAAQFAAWRVALESPVSIRGPAGSTRLTNEVFVRIWEDWSLSLFADLGGETGISSDAAPFRDQRIPLTRRAGAPSRLQPITVGSG